MKMSIADVADRYTILLLKQKHGLSVDENLLDYTETLEGMDYIKLGSINCVIWETEELVTAELKRDYLNLKEIGRMYVILRGLSLLRVDAKNELALKYDRDSPIERKSY